VTREPPQLTARRVALVGAPNCGKTALFNRLTGSRQKVANYPGVTVERKEGACIGARGDCLYRIMDLPGTYSLVPTSLDEAITRDVVTGRLRGEIPPELIICVLDATNLRLSLRLALELVRLGSPMIVALNMSDLAHRRGFRLDAAALSRELGVPVVETVAVRSGGEAALLRALDDMPAVAPRASFSVPPVSNEELVATQRDVRRILAGVGYVEPLRDRALARLDAIVMHPLLGPVLLAVLLFMVFQAVFSWAQTPVGWINAVMDTVGRLVTQVMPAGPARSLLVEGVIGGAGSVLVFLPQILILFFFILLLEDSGYLPRAAFLLDRLMGGVGLSGRSFIPLLSSFSCAIPGIMATRTIPNVRDRLATILLAPIMTCSARLPVYALIIAAFIPMRGIGPFNLQGLVLFVLYAAGVAGAVLVALVMKRATMRSSYHPLIMELPEYHWPNLRNLLMGLWERTRIFLTRVGTTILALMVLMWFLASYPTPPAGAGGPAIQYSFAGMLGAGLHRVFAPLGFNWQISLALVPGMAAREVVVGALGTVYSIAGASNAGGVEVESALRPMIAHSWSLSTALSLLAWYVFAPQCLSTLVTVRRETNTWRHPLIMAGYLFALAYVSAFVTYRIAIALGAGAS
jgi:ferrous iron transport protein B